MSQSPHGAAQATASQLMTLTCGTFWSHLFCLLCGAWQYNYRRTCRRVNLRLGSQRGDSSGWIRWLFGWKWVFGVFLFCFFGGIYPNQGSVCGCKVFRAKFVIVIWGYINKMGLTLLDLTHPYSPWWKKYSEPQKQSHKTKQKNTYYVLSEVTYTVYQQSLSLG